MARIRSSTVMTLVRASDRAARCSWAEIAWPTASKTGLSAFSISISAMPGACTEKAFVASTTRWRTSTNSVRILVISSTSDSDGGVPDWACWAAWDSDWARCANRSLRAARRCASSSALSAMGVKSILARAAQNPSKLRDRARLAPARRLPPASRDDSLPALRPPLEGVLVADLTQNVAGPSCTQILGDMGAEVIKVERPGRGDDARAWAPPYWGEERATFMSGNRDK